MVMSLAMGYAVIINLVATSRYEFYPLAFVTGAAFAVGIAMVIGTIIFFMNEPKPFNIGASNLFPSRSAFERPVVQSGPQLHTARRITMPAGC